MSYTDPMTITNPGPHDVLPIARVMRLCNATEMEIENLLSAGFNANSPLEAWRFALAGLRRKAANESLSSTMASLNRDLQAAVARKDGASAFALRRQINAIENAGRDDVMEKVAPSLDELRAAHLDKQNELLSQREKARRQGGDEIKAIIRIQRELREIESQITELAGRDALDDIDAVDPMKSAQRRLTRAMASKDRDGIKAAEDEIYSLRSQAEMKRLGMK